jgi:predicted dehydrogenase
MTKNLPLTHTKVNVALIGCGRVAGHHARAINRVVGAKLIAVCDIEEKKAKAYSDEFGVVFFTNYHDMLITHPEINTVAIITPSGMHREHSLEIIELYSKNIIIEKPTFLRPSDLINVRNAAKRQNVQLFPVFQNRYNRAIQRVKLAINQGEIGDIRVVAVRTRWCRPQRYYEMAAWRGTFSHDGGALTNQGIHHLDLLRYLGGEINSVNATMRTLGVEIEAEDTVVGTFKYSNNAVGTLEITTAARPDDFEASLSIVGSEGLVQLGGVAVNELQIFTPDVSACADSSEDFGFSVYGNGHEKMYIDIVKCLKQGKDYPISIDDCHNTLKLLHGFYKSDEISDWVEVNEDVESARLGRANDTVSNLYRIPNLYQIGSKEEI